MGLHDGHRQRKRQQFLSHGPESMADHELLELALFYAIPRRDTNETAHRLLDQYGSLDRVLSAPEQELEKVEGVGQGAAVLLRQRCAGKPVLLATHDKSAIRALGWPVVELEKLGRS